MLTKYEAAVISAHTGVLIGEYEDLKNYLTSLSGEKFLTDSGMVRLVNEYEETILEDFCALEVEEYK